ncbi:MAG: hypothetical protein LBT71_01970 [Azoarcus sp.]|nr:hypothetical protein [Azoarcus sp.]
MALSEENLHRLYGVEMKRLDFEARGEKLATLTPVFMGLGKLRAGKAKEGGAAG